MRLKFISFVTVKDNGISTRIFNNGALVLLLLLISADGFSQTFSLINIPQNTSTYTVTSNCIVSVATAGGGSKAWQGSSISTNGLGMAPSPGYAAQNCANQTGLRLEMSGAGNGSGTGAWNNSITVTVTFPLGVIGPATFSIYDLTEPLYFDGSRYSAYYQDKVTILSTRVDGSSITPALTANNGPISSAISAPGLVLTAIRNQGQCKSEPISIGTTTDLIKTITITYSNQDPPNNITAPVASPARYGISQYQYIFITAITATPPNPLPVQLTDFNGECLNNSVWLKWTTASETNNDYFSVERSPDAMNWETYATLKGAGNSNDELQYSIVDGAPLQGVSYYRLKQTDFDGKSEIFNPMAVNCESYHATPSFYVYPNPAFTSIALIFETELTEGGFITIFDLFGRKVFFKKILLEEMNGKEPNIDISSLSKGIFTIEYFTNNSREIERFIKQ